MAFYNSPMFIPQSEAIITPSKKEIELNENNNSETITVSASGVLSASSEDTSVCTVSVSGNSVTITRASSSAEGSTKVKLSTESTPRYQAGSIEIDVDVYADVLVYGVEWDGSSSPTFSRTDSAENFSDPEPYYGGKTADSTSPFDNISPWKDMKIVEDDEAGTLVEIPKFYYKWTRNGAAMKLQIAAKSKDGFLISPAHADREDGAGERDVVYVGRYHCAASTYKSTTGATPATNQNRGTFRTNIHNLGDKIWQQDYAMFWTIRMLMLVEFASWDIQSKLGGGCLGYNGSSSLFNNGSTNAQPYHTGSQATLGPTYYYPNQYRHIENLYGQVLEYIDGIYIANGKAYCIKKPSKFSDNSDGVLLGNWTGATNEIKSWSNFNVEGFEYALLPWTVEQNTSYNTYICDLCDASSIGPYVSTGGRYNNGSPSSGPFYLQFNNSTSAAYGARLMKLP